MTLMVNMKNRSDKANDFERVLKALPSAHYVLTLYVAGMALRSLQAIENVKGICEDYLKGRYELTIVDIYQHPECAESSQIFAAPTLMKERPSPLRRLIGDLSNKEHVLRGLNIAPPQADVITEKD